MSLIQEIMGDLESGRIRCASLRARTIPTVPRLSAVSDPLVITIPHRLTKDEAIRRLKNGLASANLPFLTIEREEWNGDLLEFSLKAMGQQASGTAAVQANA